MNVFFDTNILVYTVDASDPIRQERAIECVSKSIKDDIIFISTQVLQEFYSVTTRKLKPPLSLAEAAGQIELLCEFEVIGASGKSIQRAIKLAASHKMQWWDALILEAAMRAHADVLYSQDGHHGQRFGSLTVVNPFLE